MQLFFAPDITLPLYALSEEESRHAVRVLRLTEGGELSLTDGRGNLYRAVVRKADSRRCTVEVVDIEERYGRLPYSLTLAVAPPKNPERFEWMLEKATEIGVDAIVPLDCRHSERHTINMQRSGKVLVEAMKQSLKCYLPRLEPVTPFSKTVSAPFDGVKLIAHCYDDQARETVSALVAAGDNVLLLIGPEGDFSPEEVAAALEHGFRAITLGPARLRTETAAIVAAAEISIINRRCR